MDRDHAIGGIIFILSIIGIIIYGLLLWNPWTGTLYAMTVLAITAFVAIAAGLGILAWIGWTMATTPPPPPLEMPAPDQPSVKPEEKKSE